MIQADLQIILPCVSKELKQLIQDNLHSAVLYGSYARGDYNQESDIDIAIFLNCDRLKAKDYSSKLADISVDMNLEYDVLLSFHCIPIDEFNMMKQTLPYYRNIEQEGVKFIA